MTTIKVTCPDCGDIDLQPTDLQLSVAPTWATYRFRCSECGEMVRKPADTEIVDLLSSAGVPTSVIPAEVLEVRSGPVISYDDVLDFALALRDESTLQRLLAEHQPAGGSQRKRRRLRW
ncbi:MAG: hypothetical protein H6525_06770 [Actinobacteria bacterium]|nr:hypothetical protein [Actinomycetota bacterium]MCB9412532.1 hypothetical protein [Actinomycetota bacterium]